MAVQQLASVVDHIRRSCAPAGSQSDASLLAKFNRGGDESAVAGEGAALHHRAQLPDVARPAIAAQQRHRLPLEALGVGGASLARPRQEQLGQRQHLFGPVAKGWDRDGHHPEAVVEV